jgi:DNA-binding XRE family transcriptional regulator
MCINRTLREEDPAVWTQERLAVAFGVTQQCIAVWEDEWAPTDEVMHNTSSCIMHKPDARVRLTKGGKARAVERVLDGEAQEQVAADYGVSQSTISRAVTSHQRQATKREKLVAAAVAADVPSFPKTQYLTACQKVLNLLQCVAGRWD